MSESFIYDAGNLNSIQNTVTAANFNFSTEAIGEEMHGGTHGIDELSQEWDSGKIKSCGCAGEGLL
jgi:hypothetical protein